MLLTYVGPSIRRQVLYSIQVLAKTSSLLLSCMACLLAFEAIIRQKLGMCGSIVVSVINCQPRCLGLKPHQGETVLKFLPHLHPLADLAKQ